MTKPPRAPQIVHGDCLEIMKMLPDNSVDSIITDPPYGLGFMGKAWDALPPGEDWARECLRVLKPGGHLLAFGGTRTWHRLAVAVEDAGFEIRDSIAWMYGSGFPKSHDVSKAIDKRGGNGHLAQEIGTAIKAARELRGWTAGRADKHFCAGSTNWTWFEGRKAGHRPPTPEDFAAIAAEWPELAPLAAKVAEAEREVTGMSAHKSGIANGTKGHTTVGGTIAEHVAITAPATPAAQQWQGWGTALKPAFEPIVMARKPLIGTVAANVQTHGTGALNIDGCRIDANGEVLTGGTGTVGKHEGWDRPYMHDGAKRENYKSTAGRWPANVALDEHMAAVLDEQSGDRPGASSNSAPATSKGFARGGQGLAKSTGYADNGGASRFFKVAEADEHGAISRHFPREFDDKFMYVAKAPKKERPVVDGVAHATVKPLALMRWLVRLVTPEGGTVLEPFAGSGTTVEACILEGFHCIAIEREAEYLPLIQARIDRQDAA